MKLNMDFIRRAERVTSFNISTKDFETLKHKKEIQHLFIKHLFPHFTEDKFLKRVDKNHLNRAISELKREDGGKNFRALHSYNLKGVGPGEATLFFLLNEAHLGGGSSAGVDLVVGSEKYEVKAIKPVMFNGKTTYTDFKLGGTVPLSDIMLEINRVREATRAGGTKTEISKSVMAKMREKAPMEMKKIDDHFAKVAYDNYFKHHEVIFINNGTNLTKLGNIEDIKTPKLSDIMIERVTSGTIKPQVFA